MKEAVEEMRSAEEQGKELSVLHWNRQEESLRALLGAQQDAEHHRAALLEESSEYEAWHVTIPICICNPV
eukprot:2578680-Amphidinium_carterae.1